MNLSIEKSPTKRGLHGILSSILLMTGYAAVIGFAAYALIHSSSPLSFILCVAFGDESFSRSWFWWGSRSFEPQTAAKLVAGLAAGFGTCTIVMIPLLVIRAVSNLLLQLAIVGTIYTALMCLLSLASAFDDSYPFLVLVTMTIAAVLPMVLASQAIRFFLAFPKRWSVGTEDAQFDRPSIRGIMIFTAVIGVEFMLLQTLPLNEIGPMMRFAAAAVACLFLASVSLRRHTGRRTWLNFAGLMLPWLAVLAIALSGTTEVGADFATVCFGLSAFLLACRITGKLIAEYGWGEVRYDHVFAGSLR